jgi:hypothetical protein
MPEKTIIKFTISGGVKSIRQVTKFAINVTRGLNECDNDNANKG